MKLTQKMILSSFNHPHVPNPFDFLLRDTKSKFLKNILPVIFYIVKVNMNWGCQMTKKKHMTSEVHASEAMQYVRVKNRMKFKLLLTKNLDICPSSHWCVHKFFLCKIQFVN